LLNIDNKIRYKYGVSLTAVARSEVTFIDAINVNNNVNDNKTVFYADDHVLIKLLRQEKRYGAKKFITKFSSKPWTLSGLNELLLNTGHFVSG